MSSFLSPENLNYLQYELRKVYPENKWQDLQMSVRDTAIAWYHRHPQLELVYKTKGIVGLNERFIRDMIMEVDYHENMHNDVLYNSLFWDRPDPNIEPLQAMPRNPDWPMVSMLRHVPQASGIDTSLANQSVIGNSIKGPPVFLVNNHRIIGPDFQPQNTYRFRYTPCGNRRSREQYMYGVSKY